MAKVVVVDGDLPAKMVPKGLAELGIRPRGRRIVIKPNLITNRPYPVTTSPETIEALVKYLGGKSEVIVAEGSGWGDTFAIYRDQGYEEIADRHGIRLVDLNKDRYEVLRRDDAKVLKRFEFPQTLRDSYLISAAVLKRHSSARVTLSLKNMLGATIGGDKGRFHKLGIDESIVDINLYKKPNLAVIDGRLGLDSELGGRSEKFGVMIFSEDPVAADAIGTRTLGLDPLEVPHLRLAQEDGLGTCDLGKIEVVRLQE